MPTNRKMDSVEGTGGPPSSPRKKGPPRGDPPPVKHEPPRLDIPPPKSIMRPSQIYLGKGPLVDPKKAAEASTFPDEVAEPPATLPPRGRSGSVSFHPGTVERRNVKEYPKEEYPKDVISKEASTMSITNDVRDISSGPSKEKESKSCKAPNRKSAGFSFHLRSSGSQEALAYISASIDALKNARAVILQLTAHEQSCPSVSLPSYLPSFLRVPECAYTGEICLP